MKRYRGTPGLAVTLQQSVSVQEGGQAIIGNLTQTTSSALPNMTSAGPLAIPDGKCVPLAIDKEQESSGARGQRMRRKNDRERP